MADPRTLRRSALDETAVPLRRHNGADMRVRLTERPFLAMATLRVDAGSGGATAAGLTLGTPLPSHCGDVARSGPRSVLWLGPDEWLVVSSEEPEELVGALRAGVTGDRVAVVDVSANRSVLELSGDAAREVLEKGCPVDLHPRAFSEHTAVATTLARVPVLLWRRGAAVFWILPRSSYTTYVATWLLDAMQEFVPDAPGPPRTEAS